VEVVLGCGSSSPARWATILLLTTYCSPVVCCWGESLLIVVWPSPRP
jgi:hypothetical protein